MNVSPLSCFNVHENADQIFFLPVLFHSLVKFTSHSQVISLLYLPANPNQQKVSGYRCSFFVFLMEGLLPPIENVMLKHNDVGHCNDLLTWSE